MEETEKGLRVYVGTGCRNEINVYRPSPCSLLTRDRYTSWKSLIEMKMTPCSDVTVRTFDVLCWTHSKCCKPAALLHSLVFRHGLRNHVVCNRCYQELFSIPPFRCRPVLLSSLNVTVESLLSQFKISVRGTSTFSFDQ